MCNKYNYYYNNNIFFPLITIMNYELLLLFLSASNEFRTRPSIPPWISKVVPMNERKWTLISIPIIIPNFIKMYMDE